MLYMATECDNEIKHSTPLDLAIDAIRHFRPSQLADAPRSSTTPVEDQYQKEFYRCLIPILSGHVILSPEFGIGETTKGGGMIDFFIEQKNWGFELLRDRDRLVEHMKRFEPEGQYYSMIKSGEMKEYIVLDFRVSRPTKAHPGITLTPLSLASTDPLFRICAPSLPRCFL